MTNCELESQQNSRTGFESRTMKITLLLNLEYFFCLCFSFLCFQSERNLAGCVEKGIISAYFSHVKLLWMYRLRHVKLSKVTPMFS